MFRVVQLHVEDFPDRWTGPAGRTHRRFLHRVLWSSPQPSLVDVTMFINQCLLNINIFNSNCWGCNWHTRQRSYKTKGGTGHMTICNLKLCFIFNGTCRVYLIWMCEGKHRNSFLPCTPETISTTSSYTIRVAVRSGSKTRLMEENTGTQTQRL